MMARYLILPLLATVLSANVFSAAFRSLYDEIPLEEVYEEGGYEDEGYENFEAAEFPIEPVENSERAGDCSIGMNNGDLGSKQPLILKAGTSTIELPSESGYVNVAFGKTIDLHCTTSFASPLSGENVTAKCLEGSIFLVNGQKLRINNIQCSSAVSQTAHLTGRSCYGGAKIFEIGINLSIGFIRTMEVCHNLAKKATLYTRYSMSPANVAFQTSVKRPSFRTGSFYGRRNPDKLYTQETQMMTFAKILGAGSSKYFDLSRKVFLARGHIAAKTDFIYTPQQSGTFFFINVAPQWQSFNAGNWERIEDGIKEFARTRQANFDIIAGTWGVATLTDDSGVKQPLYLDFNLEGQRLIPVPKLYYRIVIDKATKWGIVLIGVNNPHISLEDIKKDYVICTDVSSSINWIRWDKTNIIKGYSYACDVNEFAKNTGELPSLSVSGLLY